MNKRNKLISALTASILAIPVAGSTVTILTTTIANNLTTTTNDLNENNVATRNSYKYLWQNKYYNSYQDIVNHILDTSTDIVIGLQQYYGDINSAIFDQTTRRVDISKLRPFDWTNPHNRISPAWINALGQHVRSYDEAKNSFINLGLVRNFYADTFGKLYLTYEEAEAVNKKGVKFDEIAYYEVKDVANNKTVQINPLNKEDIAVFQKIAFDNINNINVNNYFDFDLLKEVNQTTKSTNLKTFATLDENNEIFGLSNKELNDILSEIISNSMKEWILNLRVDVYLSLLNNNNTYSPNYSLTSSNSDWVQSVKSSTNAGNSWNDINERRDGIFKQIKIKDLGIFQSFLDEYTFYNQNDLENNNIQIDTWEQLVGIFNQRRSKWANITLNKKLWEGLDNAPTEDVVINLQCEGWDESWVPGLDVDILRYGSNNGAQLYFGVQIQENEYFINDNNKIKLNTELLFSTNNIEKESIFQKITKEYIDNSITLRKYSNEIKNDLKEIIDLINNDTSTIEVDNNGVIEKQSIRDELFNKVLIGNNFLEGLFKIYTKELMKSTHHNNMDEYKAFQNISNTFFNLNCINLFNFYFTNANYWKR